MQPVVNPMLGPSGSALIRVGARFPPCMKDVSEVPVTLQLPCKPVLAFGCVTRNSSRTLGYCQVLMTLLTHLINFVLLRSSAVMEASMVRSPINGGGKYTIAPGYG